MDRAVWIAIPMKRLRAAKSRLGDVLPLPARAGLARAMFAHVLDVARKAPVAGVLVITGDASIRAMARAAGAETLDRARDDGVSRAAGAAARSIAARGGIQMLIIPADLPDLMPADLSAMLVARGDVAIAPAKDGGTNALRLPLGRGLRFRFGPGSAALHQAEAARLKLSCRLVHRAGLARDLDTAADLMDHAA